MDRDLVINKINSDRHKLQSDFGVRHLYLFGSFARNEASSESDVDLLVEFARPTGLFGLLALQLYLEEKFERKVDLGTYNSLKPYLKENVDKDVLLVA